MIIKNKSNYPKKIQGVKVMPGEKADVGEINIEEFSKLEEVEESGDDSDQNTKDKKSDEEDLEDGGE